MILRGSGVARTGHLGGLMPVGKGCREGEGCKSLKSIPQVENKCRRHWPIRDDSRNHLLEALKGKRGRLLTLALFRFHTQAYIKSAFN